MTAEEAQELGLPAAPPHRENYNDENEVVAHLMRAFDTVWYAFFDKRLALEECY